MRAGTMWWNSRPKSVAESRRVIWRAGRLQCYPEAAGRKDATVPKVVGPVCRDALGPSGQGSAQRLVCTGHPLFNRARPGEARHLARFGQPEAEGDSTIVPRATVVAGVRHEESQPRMIRVR